jgi:hypothetical protein
MIAELAVHRPVSEVSCRNEYQAGLARLIFLNLGPFGSMRAARPSVHTIVRKRAEFNG